MEWVWWVGLMSNTITNVVGVAANIFTIFVILNRTPPQLATYSVIFLNTAFCDLFACLTALLVRQRAIPSTFGIYYIFYGPCTCFGPSVCYAIYGVMLHFISHAIWGILFSFSYRYYVINHLPPKRSTIAVVIILMYLPSLLQLVLFSLCDGDSEQVKLVIEEKFGYNVSSECVGGQLKSDWKSKYFSAYMNLAAVITFFGVLILRKLTTSSLDISTLNISENTRRLHSQLIRVPTIQACLPMFLVLATIAYVLEVSEIYRHPLLEYSFLLVAEPVPALNPFILLYAIGPYRFWVQGAFRNFWKFLQKMEARVFTVTLTPVFHPS